LSGRDVILDANLLVLLVVGLPVPELVGIHKRLKRYDTAAFNLLAEQYVPSAQVANQPESVCLGLTDVTVLLAGDKHAMLLTDDLELDLAAECAGRRAECFTNARQAACIL